MACRVNIDYIGFSKALKEYIMTLSSFIRILTVISIFVGGLAIASANTSPPSDIKLNDFIWTHHSSGVRSYNFLDVYQCALYLPKKHKPVASIRDLEHPVAIRIEILTSMLPDKMPPVWRETIDSEVTGKAFRRFKRGFASLDEGDVLLFVYLPGKATSLFLNDKHQFKDPGPGLMEALLEQWIGSHPISEDLKQALLKN